VKIELKCLTSKKEYKKGLRVGEALPTKLLTKTRKLLTSKQKKKP
jgi:hypothetical protein